MPALQMNGLVVLVGHPPGHEDLRILGPDLKIGIAVEGNVRITLTLSIDLATQ